MRLVGPCLQCLENTLTDPVCVPLEPPWSEVGNAWDAQRHALVEHLAVGSAVRMGGGKEQLDLLRNPFSHLCVEAFGDSQHLNANHGDLRSAMAEDHRSRVKWASSGNKFLRAS